MCVHLDGYQVVIAVIQVIYNKTDKYFCLTLYFAMSENGQAHSKILQHLLQDFSSVSDHFTALRSKGLNKLFNSFFRKFIEKENNRN